MVLRLAEAEEATYIFRGDPRAMFAQFFDSTSPFHNLFKFAGNRGGFAFHDDDDIDIDMDSFGLGTGSCATKRRISVAFV